MKEERKATCMLRRRGYFSREFFMATLLLFMIRDATSTSHAVGDGFSRAALEVEQVASYALCNQPAPNVGTAVAATLTIILIMHMCVDLETTPHGNCM